jgi:hypothetical protein
MASSPVTCRWCQRPLPRYRGRGQRTPQFHRPCRIRATEIRFGRITRVSEREVERAWQVRMNYPSGL